ncbi:MAG: hypothetical protein J7L54_00210 [Elusimicrobia bacterium]|nr:hypothetical protein [Elusimicrobiota bacterium]
MTDEVDILMDEAGCSRRVAERILTLYGNNLNLAFNWVASKHRNIIIFKIKFATKGTFSSGLLFLALNASAKKLLRAAVTISQNPYIYYTELSSPWRDFENMIYTHRLGEDIVHDKTVNVAQRVRGFFQDDENVSFYRIFNGPDRNEISKILGVILRKILDEDIFFEFSRERATLLEWRGVVSGEKNPAPHLSARGLGIELKMEVVRGKKFLFFGKSAKPVEKIREGDFVLAKISDSREIAQYLARLIGISATDEIPVGLEKKEKEKLGYRLVFQLGGMTKGVAFVPFGTFLKISRAMD